MDITCPYCMNPISKKTVNYECPQCGESYRGAGLFHDKMPECKNKSVHSSVLMASVVRCPHCHQKLPADYLDYDRSLKFSLVGTTQSGKTNFLISMLHELTHAMKTGLALSPLDNTREYYINFKAMEKSMFIDHLPLPATSIASEVEPYLWRIRDRNKAKGTKIPSYSLTIYDNAGEIFPSVDRPENALLAKYLCDTKSLFILIDPLQLPSFKDREGVDNISSNGVEGQSATDSINAVANFLRTNLRLGPGDLINMNVAIIFTKIDALGDGSEGSAFVDSELLYSRGDQVHLGCYDFMKQGFDMTLAKQISNSIKQYLMDNESDFFSAVESSFVANKIHYFGVSALGNPPVMENGQMFLRHLDPIRILDPFLWMMVQEGLIKAI